MPVKVELEGLANIKSYDIIQINYEKSNKGDIKADLKYLYNYIAFLIFECSFYIQKLKLECNNECSNTNIEEF